MTLFFEYIFSTDEGHDYLLFIYNNAYGLMLLFYCDHKKYIGQAE